MEEIEEEEDLELKLLEPIKKGISHNHSEKLMDEVVKIVFPKQAKLTALGKRMKRSISIMKYNAFVRKHETKKRIEMSYQRSVKLI